MNLLLLLKNRSNIVYSFIAGALCISVLLYITKSPDISTAIPSLKFQDFITLMKSMIVEALPFVLLGVSVSTLVGLFLKDEWVLKYLPKNRFISHFLISFFGVFMPVCECGNVPVARRFLTKGFNVSHSLTFLLAAPILNPITMLSTFQAFNMNHEVGYIRAFGALFISVTFGILISFKFNQESFLNNNFYENEVCHHDHGEQSKFSEGLNIFGSEFIENMKLLSIGAIIAALSQTFIPRDIIISIGQNPVLSILAMLFLAFIISICSNVDAFFALAYSTSFTLGSIITFLVFGPLIDIKILSMMKNTYSVKLLGLMTAYVTLCSVLIGLIVNYIT